MCKTSQETRERERERDRDCVKKTNTRTLSILSSGPGGSTENVNTLTNELSGFIEQLDEMKGTMADRTHTRVSLSLSLFLWEQPPRAYKKPPRAFLSLALALT